CGRSCRRSVAGCPARSRRCGATGRPPRAPPTRPARNAGAPCDPARLTARCRLPLLRLNTIEGRITSRQGAKAQRKTRRREGKRGSVLASAIGLCASDHLSLVFLCALAPLREVVWRLVGLIGW